MLDHDEVLLPSFISISLAIPFTGGKHGDFRILQ